MLGPDVDGVGVRLSPPRLENLPTYNGWLADLAVTRYLGPVHPTTEKRQEHWLEAIAKTADEVHWEIVAVADGVTIGSIRLQSISWRNRFGELAFVIGERQYWKRGFATEAVRLVTDYAFGELGLQKTFANVIDGNEGALRALAKNAYQQCVVFKRARFVEGKWRDLWVGELLREERQSAP